MANPAFPKIFPIFVPGNLGEIDPIGLTTSFSSGLKHVETRIILKLQESEGVVQFIGCFLKIIVKPALFSMFFVGIYINVIHFLQVKPFNKRLKLQTGTEEIPLDSSSKIVFLGGGIFTAKFGQTGWFIQELVSYC